MVLDERGEGVRLERGDDFSDDFGVLLDDRGEGDDEYDARLAICDGVEECEQKRRQGLASAGRDGESEEAGLFPGGGAAVIDDRFALDVDDVVTSRGAERIDVGADEIGNLLECVVGDRVSGRGLVGIHEGLGGEEVGINEAGEDETAEEAEGEVVGCSQKWRERRDGHIEDIGRSAGPVGEVGFGESMALAGMV